MNTRELVLDILLETASGREYSHIVIRNVLEKYNYMEQKDKAFVKRLAEGTLERRIQLDYCIGLYASVPVRKMKPLIRELLRMSVYQLLFMEQVPDSAVCNEAVKLAGKRKFQSLKGFVNAVLRSIARNKETLAWPEREKAPVKYLSVFYSMPEWIVEMWTGEYGEQRAEQILAGLLKERPVTVRLCENKGEQERRETLERLNGAGIQVSPHPYLPYAFRLLHTQGLSNLAPFTEGELYAQDVSSMFVAQAAGIRPGDFIIDVCAAPGGKALHAAAKLLAAENGKARLFKGTPGRVQARDLSERKTALIEENRRRLGLDNVDILTHDALILDPAMEERADIVFADLPCSGLGVIGRKKDIKYHVSPESIGELAELQRRILSVAQAYVKRGGTLVYSTCTISRRENEEQREWFLSSFPFEPTGIEDSLPEELRTPEAALGYYQFLPGIHETDGFFLAKFRKL